MGYYVILIKQSILDIQTTLTKEYINIRVGGYGKWVKSKSKCAPTLRMFRGPFHAIWNQNWVICLKKNP